MDKPIKLSVAEKLALPFVPTDIEWRIQSSGDTKDGRKWAKVLAYIDNRAIQDRLDEVFGIGGWQNEFKELSDGSMLCGIKCKIDNEWVIRWDGASKTDIEPTKGGISSAMKRAGSQWGIGRYLYNLDITFVNLKEGRGQNIDEITAVVNKQVFHFDRPKLPNWAIPKQEMN